MAICTSDGERLASPALHSPAMRPMLVCRMAGPCAIALVLCVALGGCFGSDNQSIIWIENRTDTVVGVYLVDAGESEGPKVIHGIEPGLGYSWSDIAEGCNDGLQLVAKDPSGNSIARSPTPLCRPWPSSKPSPTTTTT